MVNGPVMVKPVLLQPGCLRSEGLSPPGEWSKKRTVKWREIGTPSPLAIRLDVGGPGDGQVPKVAKLTSSP